MMRCEAPMWAFCIVTFAFVWEWWCWWLYKIYLINCISMKSSETQQARHFIIRRCHHWAYVHNYIDRINEDSAVSALLIVSARRSPARSLKPLLVHGEQKSANLLMQSNDIADIVVDIADIAAAGNGEKQDFVRLSVWWQKCGNNWRPAWNLAAMNIFEYLQKCLSSRDKTSSLEYFPPHQIMITHIVPLSFWLCFYLK